MSDTEEEQVIDKGQKSEEEVSEDKKEEGDYLEAIKSLNRIFTAHSFDSVLPDSQPSEKEFTYFSSPVTINNLLRKSYQNKSNIMEMSKEVVYELAENGELSDLFNILKPEDQVAVLSKVYSTKEHKISPDASAKETDDVLNPSSTTEDQSHSGDPQVLQELFKEYPLYTVLQALQDSKIFNELNEHLKSTTQYIHGYNNQGYQYSHFGTPYKYDNSENLIRDNSDKGTNSSLSGAVYYEGDDDVVIEEAE